MINQILLICSVIFIYEFIRFVKFRNIIKTNINIYKKIIKLFKLKKSSDFRKEKLIFIYSKLLLVISIKIFAILILIVFSLLILNMLSSSYLNFILSILGIIELSMVFGVYHSIRKKYNAKL